MKKIIVIRLKNGGEVSKELESFSEFISIKNNCCRKFGFLGMVELYPSCFIPRHSIAVVEYVELPIEGGDGNEAS